MAKKEKSPGTFVISLGRFGSAVAMTLNSLEREILGVESNSALVERFSPIFPVVEAGASRLDVMEQFGARDFPAAVAGVGALEVSVLTTASLIDIGMEQIWVKAVSREQGRILCCIGVHHVIYSESDTGRRTAHLVDGRMLDYVEMDCEGFSIVKMRSSTEIRGLTLAESDMRRHYGVNILGVISPGQHFEYAGSGTVVAANDLIIVSGDGRLSDDFANRP